MILTMDSTNDTSLTRQQKAYLQGYHSDALVQLHASLKQENEQVAASGFWPRARQGLVSGAITAGFFALAQPVLKAVFPKAFGGSFSQYAIGFLPWVGLIGYAGGSGRIHGQQLQAKHMNHLKAIEDILAERYSPDQSAVSAIHSQGVVQERAPERSA